MLTVLAPWRPGGHRKRAFCRPACPGLRHGVMSPSEGARGADLPEGRVAQVTGRGACLARLTEGLRTGGL